MGQLRISFLLGLIVFASGWMGNQGDIQKDCPSRCECSLTATPHVLCRELFSLPGVIPQAARSFHCVDCPLARMTGSSFRKYAQLDELSLAGSSRPIFDEQALLFLRGVPELALAGYSVSSSDLLSLVAPGHTLVLRNISLVMLPASSDSPVVNIF